MSLTEAELAAARAFRAAQRDALRQKNDSEPPDITVSVFIHHYRHDCARQGGKSVSLELREQYVLSPEYLVADGTMQVFLPEDAPACLPATCFPPCRFGWIFTEGRCPGCGMTARSGTGRLVDPEQRPGRYAGRER